ncbi:MAG TPA: hypothetical protein VI749_01590 [Candidatus Omnitrophota bacterium]|nr:hypothetical protein [Candidatus Omnitrophota bacterium]
MGTINRCKIITLMLVAGLSGLGFSSPHFEWNKIAYSGYDATILSVSVDPTDPNLLYYGTDKSLYQLNLTQKTHQVLLNLQGEKSSINDIGFARYRPSVIFAATGNGLYQSDDKGLHWERIFHSSDENERQCTAVAADEDRLYLGTRKGLFYKGFSQPRWQKMKGELSDLPISDIVVGKNFVYAADTSDVFRINKATFDYAEIFSLGPETSEEEEDASGTIKTLQLFTGANNILLVGSRKGIFSNIEDSHQWLALVVDSIPLERLTTVIAFRDQSHGQCDTDLLACMGFVIATERGAFLYENGGVTPVYKGMATNVIHDLALGLDGQVYAATNEGLYHISIEPTLPVSDFPVKGDYAKLNQIFGHEPPIKEVHEMAIDYADVHPQKIKDWQRQARWKTVLPSLSAGVDRSATERLHWDTGQSPDELVKGDDFLEWDVSVSWDLSDFIWSTDQTTIDSRAKLMVELREDILDQITRLYFERRRLQMELQMPQADPYVTFDKQMRVDELTALIDALTGGEFSKKIVESRQTSDVSHQKEEK